MDNMLDISREAFPNPALSRLSSVLHESESATRRGIDRAFPVSLTGLAEHVKRGNNAQDLLGHFEKGDLPHLAPIEVAPLVTDPMRTARLAASGEGFLARIFGTKLDEVVDMVARQAGVSRTSAHVILGLSAPLLLDAISKESEIRHFDAAGLSRFLADQEERARSILPAVVERAASASASARPIAEDREARPLFAGGPAAPTYQSTAAMGAALGGPVSQLHTPTRGQTGPSLDQDVERSLARPTLPRSLLWLLAAVAAFALLTWGLLRLAPRPQPVPAAPGRVGATEPTKTPRESLPGGVSPSAPAVIGTGEPSESATAAGETLERGEAMARIPASESVAGRGAAREPRIAATERAREPVTPESEAIRQPALTEAERAPVPISGEELSDEEAVRALANQPRAQAAPDSLTTVLLPDRNVGGLGALARKDTASVAETGKTEGIVETQRTNVPKAATGKALPRYFERGSLPPKRFVLHGLSFAPGSAILEGQKGALDRAAKILRAHPGATVLIEGYLDKGDDLETEGQLPLERAEAVKRYLIDRGVPPDQLKTAELPAPTLKNQKARRVDMVVLTR